MIWFFCDTTVYCFIVYFLLFLIDNNENRFVSSFVVVCLSIFCLLFINISKFNPFFYVHPFPLMFIIVFKSYF